METIFINTEDSKTNEQHEFVLNLSQRLDLIKKLEKMSCSSKFVYLLQMEKYKTTVQKQEPQIDNSNVEWQV